MTVEIRKFPDADSVATAAAQLFLDRVRDDLAAKPLVHVALTGGTVGIATLAALGRHVDRDSIDYSRVHIWWGDERFVERSSRDRNAVLAREAYLSKISIPEGNIHEFPAANEGKSLSEARESFSLETAGFASSEGTIDFDLVFLGMGPDGHVASLFPGHDSGSNSQFVIAEHDSPKPPPERLSLSYRALNAAKRVVFVVAGLDKAEAVMDAFGNPGSVLPAAKVRGASSSVLLVDEAAASLLG